MEAEDGSHTRSLKTNQFFAVCVRGFPGDPRAPLQNSTYNGVAVFPDNLTGLMWDAATAVSVPWSQALSYCEGSTTGGLGDWRLPNKHELETVLELSNETPSILPVNADNAYWTSTTFAERRVALGRSTWLAGSIRLNPKRRASPLRVCGPSVSPAVPEPLPSHRAG